ncbi:MAG: hypothetical protein AAGA75_17980 [Cyanobacteria bacterium P01_E01_bin.6]
MGTLYRGSASSLRAEPLALHPGRTWALDNLGRSPFPLLMPRSHRLDGDAL